MSFTADYLAKIKSLIGLGEIQTGQKRRADNTNQDFSSQPKYRRITENFIIKPTGEPSNQTVNYNVNDYGKRRTIGTLYRKLNFLNRSNNINDTFFTKMGKNSSKHRKLNDDILAQHRYIGENPDNVQIELSDDDDDDDDNDNENVKTRNGNSGGRNNGGGDDNDHDDEIVFVQQHSVDSRNKFFNLINENRHPTINVTNNNNNTALRNHMNQISTNWNRPSISGKRNKFSRIPDLHPIGKPSSTSSVLSRSQMILNGALNKTNSILMNGSSASTSIRNLCDSTDFKSNFSLRKNVSTSIRNNSVMQCRNVAPVNSIVPKQLQHDDRKDYEELLRKLVPDFGVSSKDTSKDQSYLVENHKPRRTETEIMQDLRNSKYFIEDTIETEIKIDPINTLRPKVESKREFSDAWLDNLNKKYSGMKLQLNETIHEEKQKVQQSRLETKANERIYQNRMVKEWRIPDVIVIDDEIEEEQINEFPDLTAEQSDRVMKAMNGPTDHVLIEKYNIRITCFDIASLDWGRNNWLNDEVINFYMNLIMDRSEKRPQADWPRVYAMNTFFIPRLLSSGYAAVRRWTRKIDLFSYAIVPVPVHVGGVHWCLACIDFRDKTIKYYDSMGSPNRQVLLALEQYIKEESKDKLKKDLNTADWTLESVPDIPKQGNGSDCGVFSCTFAEFLSRNRPFHFTQANMVNARKKMVYEIITGELIL